MRSYPRSETPSAAASKRMRLPSRFRVDPASFPVYYGWVVLAAGGLGMLFTAPGQTIGVSAFNDYLIDALGLTRTAISTAYMIGTTLSAVFIARAGRSLDRRGSRVIGTIAAASLGVSVLGMTQVDRAAAAVAVVVPDPAVAAFVAITAAFFLLRFFGQGVLMLSSQNMVTKWFDRRRGLVTALLGLFVTFGFSSVPIVFDALIQRFSWRGAWAVIGATLIGFAGVIALLFRDNPKACGLQPDGPAPPPADEAHAHPPRTARWRRLMPARLANLKPVGATTGADRTLAEARRTLIYWVLVSVLGLSSAIGTAFTFHVVSIFETAGFSRAAAVGIFMPAAVVSIAMKLVTSWASTYVRIRVFPVLHAVLLIVLLVAIAVLRSPGAIALVLIGHGGMQGMLTVNANLAFPRLFGLKYLGSIRGATMKWGVVGSAVGPYIYSAFFDISGDYALISLLLIVPVLVILALGVYDYLRERRRDAVAGSFTAG